ncbi:hypothetical protein AM499_10860 [Bacillus sp. FJAT-22090]|nr:hypothetical protein AM499_10860 [Bacillus sp. FJAT-22090]
MAIKINKSSLTFQCYKTRMLDCFLNWSIILVRSMKKEQEVRRRGATPRTVQAENPSPRNVAKIKAFAKKSAVKLSEQNHYTSTF